MQLMFALMIMYRLKHGNCILASNLTYGKQGVAHTRFHGDISRSQRVRITFTFCCVRPIVRGIPLRMIWLGNVPAVGFYTEDDFRHFFPPTGWRGLRAIAVASSFQLPDGPPA